MKLSKEFYLEENVVALAEELIGKVLVTSLEGYYCSGIITETEAYNGINDKASHAYGGRRTPRTEVMYAEGGISYVYLCYGIHSLFNVVSGIKDVPQAILVRGILPVEGVSYMVERRKRPSASVGFTAGPGKVSEALGIHYNHSGCSLSDHTIWIEDRGYNFRKKEIQTGVRIGVDYAGPDALLPYRFFLKNEAVRALKL